MTEVCKKAGVSKNTFYRHFESLSDVIYKEISEINDSLADEAFSLASHSADDFILHACNAWYKNRTVCSGFSQPPEYIAARIKEYLYGNIFEYLSKYL